jgi:hypothetical protein
MIIIIIIIIIITIIRVPRKPMDLKLKTQRMIHIQWFAKVSVLKTEKE